MSTPKFTFNKNTPNIVDNSTNNYVSYPLNV